MKALIFSCNAPNHVHISHGRTFPSNFQIYWIKSSMTNNISNILKYCFMVLLDTHMVALRSVRNDILLTGCTTAKNRSNDIKTNVYTLAWHVTTIIYCTCELGKSQILRKEEARTILIGSMSTFTEYVCETSFFFFNIINNSRICTIDPRMAIQRIRSPLR